MKSRHWFPPDLAALLFSPIIMTAVSLLLGSLFPMIHRLRNPTPHAWLWALGIATSTSILGIVLLFVAKLPQYRAGIFLRVGSHHLPPRHQQLYRLSFSLIIPSVIVLSALLWAAHRFPK
jgi:hypothetical protein